MFDLKIGQGIVPVLIGKKFPAEGRCNLCVFGNTCRAHSGFEFACNSNQRSDGRFVYFVIANLPKEEGTDAV